MVYAVTIFFSSKSYFIYYFSIYIVQCLTKNDSTDSDFLVAGCISACNRQGSCVMFDGDYQCQCSDGWAGADCSVRLEVECSDEEDNDEGRLYHFVLLELFPRDII